MKAARRHATYTDGKILSVKLSNVLLVCPLHNYHTRFFARSHLSLQRRMRSSTKRSVIACELKIDDFLDTADAIDNDRGGIH